MWLVARRRSEHIGTRLACQMRLIGRRCRGMVFSIDSVKARLAHVECARLEDAAKEYTHRFGSYMPSLSRGVAKIPARIFNEDVHRNLLTIQDLLGVADVTQLTGPLYTFNGQEGQILN
jgi:hypothetical protein